jgi:hypothetical protein
MRLQTMNLPAEGWDFALIIDQAEDITDGIDEALAAFGRCVGAKATLVVPGTVEVL